MCRCGAVTSEPACPKDLRQEQLGEGKVARGVDMRPSPAWMVANPEGGNC